MPPGEMGTTMAAGWFGSLRRIGKKNSNKSSQNNGSQGAISSVVQASCLSLTSLEDVSYPGEVSTCPRLIEEFARSNSRVSVSTTDTDRDCSNSHCDDLIRESSVAEQDEDQTFGNTSSDATRPSAKPPSGAKSKSRKSRFWSTNASQPELHKLATVTNKPSPTHSSKSVGYTGRASYAKTLGRNNKRSTVWHHQSEWDLVRQPQLRDEIAEVTAEMESMDNGEESKNALKAKHLSMGRKKFNMDPKKGIEFLVEHGLLRHTPEEVALFLYRGEGLNKTAIGDYLGERHDFNEKVLKAFVELHDFTDLILVQALRQFLWSFRLPGEAQKIDRMMECFAQRYCQLNPNIFSSLDTCYILSFSVIMLNTSLHNPSVKDKPTLENFISMNREIDHGKDVPRDILASLYESIKAEPFKIPEDDGNDLMHTFFNPDREGWLCKQGGRYKSWKRRWFILNDNCLYYFEYTTDKEPRGIIPLENIQVREVHDRHKPNCFELYATGSEFIKACKTDSEGKVVEGKHQVYRMSAATAEEKDAWIACIKTSISHNPFYDMLAARKKNAQKGIKTKS